MLFLLSIFLIAVTGLGHAQTGITYYVSDSDGNDGNTGLSQTPGSSGPFKTIGHVNSLNLQPGDQVRFKCGDTWRGEMLIIKDSGDAANPITFGSYPTADCADKPIISGAQPISGWTLYSGNIYRADLPAGTFPYGVNQLFRNNQRLPLGRWPNLGTANGGYSTIDDQPAANRITDNQLPGVDWTGAIAHIRGMRWYILNRQVTADSGSTLTLGANADCWGGNCADWGFFLNNHLSTLDSEGEWYYDAAARWVYLYTTGGTPADNVVEGSIILKDDDRSWGGIMLGEDLNEPGISYVVIENFDVRRWFRHGIATPTNHAHYENHHITLQNNTIADVDRVGINLAAWVWGAQDGRPDGWRGGYNMTVTGNTIVRANSRGLDAYSHQSTFANNTIQDVGLIENLGAAGMGCSLTTGEGGCTEDGDGIRIKVDKAADSGNNNTVSGNWLERVAYNGIDVFGHTNTFATNVIRQACYAKGDCGGMRTFGNSNLTSTPVHDLTISNNIIVDIPGNTDGCNSTYSPLFGMGLYIDNYSRDVQITGNSVLTTTFTGILYQRSTGTASNNTVYNASSGTMYTGQINVGGSGAQASLNGNIMYGLGDYAWLLVMDGLANIAASDYNYFFHPYEHTAYVDKKIIVGGWSGRRNLAEWQAYSGLDGNSKKHWFTLGAGDPPRSHVFYNDTMTSQMVDLGSTKYLTLDQQEVTGSIMLAPFTSKVLIDSGEVALAPASLVFENSSSPAQVITLKNITGSSLAISDIAVSAGFSIDSETCPATLAIDETCTVTISFNSAQTGVTGTLTVTHNAGSPYTANLTGGLLKTFLPIVVKSLS